MRAMCIMASFGNRNRCSSTQGTIASQAIIWSTGRRRETADSLRQARISRESTGCWGRVQACSGDRCVCVPIRERPYTETMPGIRSGRYDGVPDLLKRSALPKVLNLKPPEVCFRC
jgi:hypothetical protein